MNLDTAIIQIQTPLINLFEQFAVWECPYRVIKDTCEQTCELLRLLVGS